MPMKVDFVEKCQCKHDRQFHISWGGMEHYHEYESMKCYELHGYCMITDCHCVSFAGTGNVGMVLR